MMGHLESCLLCQSPPFSGSQSPNYTMKDSEERLCMCVEIYASAVPGSDISAGQAYLPNNSLIGEEKIIFIFLLISQKEREKH